MFLKAFQRTPSSLKNKKKKRRWRLAGKLFKTNIGLFVFYYYYFENSSWQTISITNNTLRFEIFFIFIFIQQIFLQGKPFKKYIHLNYVLGIYLLLIFCIQIKSKHL